jgi:glycosyltransferase involved in cell wall biosynthesis
MVTTGAAIVFLLPVEPLKGKEPDITRMSSIRHRYVRLSCGMRGPLVAMAQKVKGQLLPLLLACSRDQGFKEKITRIFLAFGVKGIAVPTISLILPVYNGERFLREALDSIFAQSFTDFELIAVDDCSTDTTPHILKEYAAHEPRMRIVNNAVNSKLPATLNNGFREAKGEWYSWTSDDNIMRPHMLERLLEVALANPVCDIVHSDFSLIDEDGTLGEMVFVDPAHELIFGNAIGCSFLYKKQVDKALNGYDENLFGIEDYDFWLRAARQFKFFTLHEDLYLYRRHPGSLTSAKSRHIHALAAKVMLREIETLPKSPLRAEAYVRLAIRDHHTLRLNLLWRSFQDHPATFFRYKWQVLKWLRYSLKTKIMGTAAIAAIVAVSVAAVSE